MIIIVMHIINDTRHIVMIIKRPGAGVSKALKSALRRARRPFDACLCPADHHHDNNSATTTTTVTTATTATTTTTTIHNNNNNNKHIRTNPFDACSCPVDLSEGRPEDGEIERFQVWV